MSALQRLTRSRMTGLSIWPKSSLEYPEARKRNWPEQSENRSVTLCQVVKGIVLLRYYYVSVLFSFFIYPSLFCESVLLFVLSKSRCFEIIPRSFVRSDHLGYTIKSDRAAGEGRTSVIGASGSRECDGKG